MVNRSIITPVFLILILTLSRCVDPYFPKLYKYQSLLVVNAILTNEEVPFYVRLTRTSITPDETPAAVTGAQVSIKDELGNITSLGEDSDGIYKAGSKDLKGIAGREYILKITTKDGKEYESEPCMLNNSLAIDTLYYGKVSQITDNGQVREGIMVYVDSKEPAENKNVRWCYEEWWKFNIPYPVTYKYVDEAHIYEVPIENVTCYKNRKSDEVIIQPPDQKPDAMFIKRPICFIPSEMSDRLLIQYCIQVSQYTISEKEYEYWRQMKEINESGGDIFEKQPYQIISNIHCVSDPGETVLGYFQVCGASSKRIYIKRSDIDAMGLPLYRYDCDLVINGPGDYAPGSNMTFDRIYRTFTMQNYNFIAPHYKSSNSFDRLIFVDKYCSDCTTSGNPNKPDFWVDLE